MKYLLIIFIFLVSCTQMERVNDDKIILISTTIESSEPVIKEDKKKVEPIEIVQEQIQETKQFEEMNETNDVLINGKYKGINEYGIEFKAIKGINKWEFRRYYFEENEMKGRIGIIYEIVKWDNKLDGTRIIYFYYVLYEQKGAKVYEGDAKFYKKNISQIDFLIVREELRLKAIEDFNVNVLNKVR